MATATTEQAPAMLAQQQPQQQQKEPVDFWKAIQAHRTNAIPKHTLFGSSLENFTDEELEIVKKLDPNTKLHQQKTDRFTLPDSLKSQLPANRIVERSRKEYEEQQRSFDTARKHLNSLEREALTFRGTPQPCGRQSQEYITKEARDVLKEMNHVGLNANNSYNRDKYKTRPPAHQYSLMGDVMRHGNEFYRRERTDVPIVHRKSTDSNQPEIALIRQASARDTNSPRAVIRLPPNIRHQFGSRICDNLLADEKVVEKTVKEQERIRELLQRGSKPVKVPKLKQKLNPEYESLGNAMRMNVFPGYTINHKISTMKDTFTDSVFLKRYQDPDKWRMQRDELSTWAEFNVLQDRMKRSWEEYLSNRPKTEPNWDRTAKQPRTKPTAETKPKQKPKKQTPKEKPKDEPVFEDVKFETPPVTPPPAPLSPVKLQPKSEKDSEFWDFYDKGGKT